MSVCVSIAAVLLLGSVCAEHPRGHLQPLGSHVGPLSVDEITHTPTPLEFHERYVQPKRPVLLKGLLGETTVLANWQSDSYLRSHFGTEEMSMERGKKENRSEYGFTMTMREFLDQYQSSDIYMVSDLAPGMKEEWVLPRFLLCGGYTDHLMYVYIWFSSGGTKSVLHTDSYENLHCLVSGRKEFVLIEPQYADVIGPEHAQQGFFNLDVERVDMYAYPNLVDVPWYKVTVDEGDCLYVPYLWIHHVDSYGRNMGVNAWWMPFTFAEGECEFAQLPDFAPLSDFPISPELQLKAILQELMREDGTVHAEDMHRKSLEMEGVMPLEGIVKMFEMLFPGCHGVLSRDQLNSISRETFHKAFEFIISVSEDPRSHDPSHDPSHDFEYFDGEFGGHGDYDIDDTDHMTEGGGDFHDEL